MLKCELSLEGLLQVSKCKTNKNNKNQNKTKRRMLFTLLLNTLLKMCNFLSV